MWYRLCRPIVQLVYNFFETRATPYHLQKSNAVNFSYLLKDKSGENMRYIRKLCSFSYLISSFFNRSTIGSLAGMLIYLSSYLPYIVCYSHEPHTRMLSTISNGEYETNLTWKRKECILYKLHQLGLRSLFSKYRSGTVNSKFHLIRSYYEIFF